jgi:SAM-dependent methyltransferase
LEFARAYWGISAAEVESCIAGIPGRRWLQHLWDTSAPAVFYRHPYQLARQEWFHAALGARPVGSFLSVLRPGDTVLDYGCGTGEWLRRAWIERGGTTYLVDQEGPLQPYLTTKYPALVGHVLTTAEWDRGGPATTALVLLDVLEHVQDPLSLLQRLWDRLAPGGIAALWFDHSWPHPGHLRSSIEQIPAYWEFLHTYGVVLQETPITLVRKRKRIWAFFREKVWRPSTP